MPLAQSLAIALCYFLLTLVAMRVTALFHLGSDLYTLGTQNHPQFYWKDSTFFVWCYAWWPHAIAHGLNPFVTDYLWYPLKVNLAYLTSIPTLSLLSAPLTIAFGPVFSYNLVQLMTPALNSHAAFALCRQVTKQTAPSVFGGFVFGFSPYVFCHLPLHPNLSFVALLPLAVLLYLKWRDGTVGDAAFALGGAALIAAEAGISLEVLSYCAIAAAVGLALDYRALTVRRGMVLAAMGAVALGLMSPLLYYFLLAGRHTTAISQFSAAGGDLLYALVPLQNVWLNFHGLLHHLGLDRAADPETDQYIGPLLIALLVIYRRRIAPPVQIMVVGLSLVGLGTPILFNGQRTSIPNPFALIHGLPLMGHALIVRFSVLAFLAAAVAVSQVLSYRGTRAYAIASLACLTLFPNPKWSEWIKLDADFAPPAYSPVVPAAFFSKSFAAELVGKAYIVLPYYGLGGLWQAVGGLSFRAFGDYTGMNPSVSLDGRLSPDRALIAPLANQGLGRIDRAWALSLTDYCAERRIHGILLDPDPWAPVAVAAALKSVGWTERDSGRLMLLTPPATQNPSAR